MRSPFDTLARLRGLAEREAAQALAEALRGERTAVRAAVEAEARLARARASADQARCRDGPVTGASLAGAGGFGARLRLEEPRHLEATRRAAGEASRAATRREEAAAGHQAARAGRRAVEELAGRWREARRRALERRAE